MWSWEYLVNASSTEKIGMTNRSSKLNTLFWSAPGVSAGIFLLGTVISSRPQEAIFQTCHMSWGHSSSSTWGSALKLLYQSIRAIKEQGQCNLLFDGFYSFVSSLEVWKHGEWLSKVKKQIDYELEFCLPTIFNM